MWYDTVIAIVIVLTLLLAIVARLSRQTFMELLNSIFEFITGKTNDLRETMGDKGI